MFIKPSYLTGIGYSPRHREYWPDTFTVVPLYIMYPYRIMFMWHEAKDEKGAILMVEKRMLTVPSELVKNIDENRGDLSQAEYIHFLIQNALEERTKTPSYATKEESEAIEEELDRLAQTHSYITPIRSSSDLPPKGIPPTKLELPVS